MDLSTGNSGNSLFGAVVKIGNECQQEGAYCEVLGSEVAPKIYAIIDRGYVMEKLQPVDTEDPYLLRKIEKLLIDKVWSRSALPSSSDSDWRDKLKIYDIDVPDWVIPDQYCMVHGDPTVSNALMRDNQLILADPRPPRDYIPQCRETDMGRILQSFLGWEQIAYGKIARKYLAPLFCGDLKYSSKARFWCSAAAARISYLECSRAKPRLHIIDWCNQVRGICK